MSIRTNYKFTLCASYLGFINLAIVNNFTPLLFVTFNSSLNISILRISSLITVNFMTQLLVDLVSTKAVDKVGYRFSAVTAHIFSFIGLVLLGILPFTLFDGYIALLISTVFCAIGGGLCEVIISPIVEACPTDNKASNMSLLHSFYCWGQLAVIIFSSIFFSAIGLNNWRYMSFFWALIPLFNSFLYCLVPINILPVNEHSSSVRSLFRNKIFYVFLLLMLCSGACELTMSQWISTFSEVGLGINKEIGDLLGPSIFALLMGVSRVFYFAKNKTLDLKKFILICSILCLACYLTTAVSSNRIISLLACAFSGFTVGIMWPGVFSVATPIFKGGSTAMFALLALAGDLGCSVGPTVFGIITDSFNSMRMGFAVTSIFPLLMISGILILNKTKVYINEENKKCT